VPYLTAFSDEQSTVRLTAVDYCLCLARRSLKQRISRYQNKGPR